jgi:alkanesulfonate monooxygenase SsuD/methylene tetrahydromethanopterin reductase-like flavin-dependent oxidoreductase (luciferase family)
VLPAVNTGFGLRASGSGGRARDLHEESPQPDARSRFTLASSCFVIVGDTEAERSKMAEEVRQQISFYASTRTYEPVLAAHGWESLNRDLHQKSLDGDWKGMAALITDEMLDVFAVFGTWEDLGPKLRARYEGLLDRISLYSVRGTSPLDDARLLHFVRDFNS